MIDCLFVVAWWQEFYVLPWNVEEPDASGSVNLGIGICFLSWWYRDIMVLAKRCWIHMHHEDEVGSQHVATGASRIAIILSSDDPLVVSLIVV